MILANRACVIYEVIDNRDNDWFYCNQTFWTSTFLSNALNIQKKFRPMNWGHKI